MTLTAEIDLTNVSTTRRGWLMRADEHYAAAVRQHTSGDTPPAVTANEIRLAELALELAKSASSNRQRATTHQPKPERPTP